MFLYWSYEFKDVSELLALVDALCFSVDLQFDYFMMSFELLVKEKGL
jgi:hypothetical protein